MRLTAKREKELRNDALRAELERWRREAESKDKLWRKAVCDRSLLILERNRLREALKDIAKDSWDYSADVPTSAALRARKALNAEQAQHASEENR